MQKLFKKSTNIALSQASN
jgi:dihydropyrimidinase